MCGIAGILALNGPTPDLGAVAAMTEALAHRGPNGGRVVDLGPLVLGHRRLSILDPTPAGDQPMQTPDGRYHLVHNGEIYNFLELAVELEGTGWTFRTKTDTEVILAAYHRWGPACVERFNGIWAFVLWDAQDRRLLLSRDRLGVKPLFVTEVAGGLAFASEIKALLAIPGLDRRPDAGIARDYLLGGIVDYSDRTFFGAIRRVPAAHNLVVDVRGERRDRYWPRYWPLPSLSDDVSARSDPQDAERVETVRCLLIASVALELRSDVAIGSCLSEGLDSSSIVAIADGLRRGSLVAGDRHHERDRHPQLAFFASFDDPGIDERRYVADVDAQTGIELRTTSPDAGDFVRSIEAIVRAQDEPFGSSSIVAQYHVMRAARDAGVKVMLDGQGADELFGGYPVYLPQRAAGRLRRGDVRVLSEAATGNHGPGLPILLGAALANGRRRPTWARSSRAIGGWLGPATREAHGSRIEIPAGGTLLGRVLVRDQLWSHLPALLRYEDRNSMAFGIEARVPFLDHRLVEFAAQLPDRLKISGTERKVALRRAAADFLPPSILARRDKIGFETPAARWFGERVPDLRALASPCASGNLGLLQRGTVAQAFDAWSVGRLGRGPFWRILNLELWAQNVTRDAAAG